MKIIILDISGKVPFYEHALCTALESVCVGTKIELATPYKQECYSPTYKIKRLIRFYCHENKSVHKIIKAAESLFNYLCFTIGLLFQRYDVIHFQWLPFLEYTSIEKFFLSLYKFISPKTRFILTQHNTFPHNSTILQKEKYRIRMRKIDKYIDKYIVHTNSSKEALSKEFGISLSKIEVIYHGIFVPEKLPQKTITDEKLKFLMFGIQSKYKGTDILVDAIARLPKNILECINVSIAGKTDESLFQEKYELANSLGIKWESRFFENEELNQLIMDSDILVFPYRSISQSGALLLALAFGKPMIVSKLPSFVETLEGFPKDAFIEVESVESLCDTIVKHTNGEINISDELKIIVDLQKKYSWQNSAKKTFELYNNIK